MDGPGTLGAGTDAGTGTGQPAKKNSVQTRFGRVAIAKTNPFSAPVLGSRTSPYLQAKLVLLAAEHVYA